MTHTMLLSMMFSVVENDEASSVAYKRCSSSMDEL